MRNPHNPTPRWVCAGWALLVALALWLPHSASATPPPEGWGAAEMQIAAGYWGVSTPPDCASTEVQFDATLPVGLAGYATVPHKAETECRMWIATAEVIGGLYYQCVTVVHEFGHWMGLEHSADTSSPMATQLNLTIYIRGCALLAGVRRASVTKITHTGPTNCARLVP